ncbi:MAG: hypothetical protein BWY76_02295 [bacterium ADurb.Bin429]|nr:MAG: hypothetical protein BWY76_02295 [bacterium ADurb.Bin429]
MPVPVLYPAHWNRGCLTVLGLLFAFAMMNALLSQLAPSPLLFYPRVEYNGASLAITNTTARDWYALDLELGTKSGASFTCYLPRLNAGERVSLAMTAFRGNMSGHRVFNTDTDIPVLLAIYGQTPTYLWKWRKVYGSAALWGADDATKR